MMISKKALFLPCIWRDPEAEGTGGNFGVALTSSSTSSRFFLDAALSFSVEPEDGPASSMGRFKAMITG